MGISRGGVVGDFPFVLLSLLGISHLFSYLWLFPYCYWLLGNRFELSETNLPLPIAPQKCYRGRFVQGYVSIARIMSHRTRRQDVGQSQLIPSENLYRLLYVCPVLTQSKKNELPSLGVAITQPFLTTITTYAEGRLVGRNFIGG